MYFDNVSSVDQSDSDDNIGMGNLTEGDEDDDFEAQDTDNIDDDRTQTQEGSELTQEATLVSRSPAQGLGSRRD